METIKKALRAVAVFFVLVFVSGSLTAAAYFTGVVSPQVHRVEVPVREAPRTVDELVREVSHRYGVSTVVLEEIVRHESGGKVDAIRFEPSQLARAQKITKNPEQQRMYASSHGLGQVMGWWAREFNISWADLYDPETNLEVSCLILRRALDRHKNKPMPERLYRALVEYNGSTKYADLLMRRIGDRLIAERLS